MSNSSNWKNGRDKVSMRAKRNHSSMLREFMQFVFGTQTERARRKKLLAYSLIALLIFLTAIYGLLISNEKSMPEYITFKLKKGDILIAVSASGTIEPVEVVDVGAQIVGMIKEFGVDPNDPDNTIDFGARVKKGTVLARIDDAIYQSELDKAQADLKLANADIRKARIQLDLAEGDWERMKRAKNSTSETAYEHARADFKIAQAELSLAQAHLEQAQVASKRAQIDLGYTVIHSPVDGIVIDRRVDIGQTVVAGLNAPSLFLLAKDLSQMQIRAAVNEADMGNIFHGQRVFFTVDAYPEHEFTGTVSQIRLNASVSQHVVTYDVIVDIDIESGLLLPFMTASMKFIVDERRDIFKAPLEAFSWRSLNDADVGWESGVGRKGMEDGPRHSDVLWLYGPEEIEPLKVTRGLSDRVFVEVEGNGLTDGLPIVVGIRQQQEDDFGSTILKRIQGR